MSSPSQRPGAVVRITSWRPGLKKIAMTKAIQRATGLGLPAAKLLTDRVLDGNVVALDVADDRIAQVLAIELCALGVDAKVADELERLFHRLDGTGVFEQRVDSVHTANVSGDTPLHVATRWGDVDAVRLLLQNGVDVNCRGEDGFTALHWAATKSIECVRCLLEHGAANLRDDLFHQTPKERAQLRGLTEVVRLLDEHGY